MVFRFELAAAILLIFLAAMTPMVQSLSGNVSDEMTASAADRWEHYGRTFGLGGAPDLGRVDSIPAIQRALYFHRTIEWTRNRVNEMVILEPQAAQTFSEAAKLRHLPLSVVKERVAVRWAMQLLEGKVQLRRHRSGDRSLIISSCLGASTHREWDLQYGVPSDGDYWFTVVDESGVHLELGLIAVCGNAELLAAGYFPPAAPPRTVCRPRPQPTLPADCQPSFDVSVVGGSVGSVNGSWQLAAPVPGQVIIPEPEKQQPAVQSNGGSFSADVNIPGSPGATVSSASSVSSSASSASVGGGASASAGQGSSASGSTATIPATPPGNIHIIFHPNGR